MHESLSIQESYKIRELSNAMPRVILVQQLTELPPQAERLLLVDEANLQIIEARVAELLSHVMERMFELLLEIRHLRTSRPTILWSSGRHL